MTMFWGYNTNGCQNHLLEQAIPILADLGYLGVAITLDQYTLNPFSIDLQRQLRRVCRLLQRTGMHTVIETGARYLLNERTKHHPTLLTDDAAERQIRIEFLKRAIDVAAELCSDCVSFWSGGSVSRAGNNDETSARLHAALQELLQHADRRDITLALEPEPGMWIETTQDARRWIQRLDSPRLALTLDVGHVYCLDEGPPEQIIRECGAYVCNVHIEDMTRGAHEHLMFGDGGIDFTSVLAALRQIGYDGGVYVELSRHSHVFPQAAARAWEFLQCHNSR